MGDGHIVDHPAPGQQLAMGPDARYDRACGLSIVTRRRALLRQLRRVHKLPVA